MIFAVPSRRLTQDAFLNSSWKARELHLQVTPRSHRQQHNRSRARRPIGKCSEHYRGYDRWLLQKKRASYSPSTSRSAAFGQLEGRWGIRASIPRKSAAKPLCTCSGDPSGCLRKQQCTLTIYGKKKMEIFAWRFLCAITWRCFGKWRVDQFAMMVTVWFQTLTNSNKKTEQLQSCTQH